jgi:peptide/nickel transport system substrate-binding protein
MRRALVLGSALILLLAAPDLRAQETPRAGGILKVATIGEPPTLDIQMSTTILTYEIMWHVFESLFTYDHALNPIPLLAESHEVGERGLRHTITLRRGVRFHHGKEMTAADVVPSLKRWGRAATLGRILWNDIESIEAKNSYTVVLRLKQPSASLVYGLAEPAAMIYPRELVETAGDVPIKEFIGTGPYRFVEHKPDRHIRLARFADYAARAEPPNGFGGRRVAWLDEILFIPVPDSAARLAGVEAGSFHLGVFMEPDAFERIRNLPALEPRIVKPQSWALASLNHKAGLMTSKALRQALQAALDIEPIMRAGFGHPMFYRLQPGLFFPEQPWHSTAGAHLYNQRDRQKAQRLLKEAAYAQQPVRWITNREYEFMYRTAVVAKQQLEEVGFVIDLQLVDWATQNHLTQKPELWDVYSTGFPLYPDPAIHVALRCSFQGWWCNEEKERLVAQLRRESDPKRRKALVDQIQAVYYEDVGQVKLGDFFGLDAVRRELRGEFRTAPRRYLWNSWLVR